MAKPGRHSKSHVTGSQRLVRRLRTIQAATAVALSADGIENLLVKRTKQRFLAGIDPKGVAWRDLAQSTQDEKTKKGYPRKDYGSAKNILIRTGRLYESIAVIQRNQTSLASPTGAGFSIGVKPSNNGKYGDPAVYGRRHQFGQGRVPQRRFLGVSAEDVKSVDGLLRREIVKKAGLS